MQTQLPKSEKLVEFLIADFNDTSEHLKVTGRKIEFTFQLYAGLLSLLITLVVSLLTIAPAAIVDILYKLDSRILYGITSAILALIAAVTWWVFEFTLRGSKMNSLYINRMNFLRCTIYQSLGKKTIKLDGFAYVSQLLPKTKAVKVGMTDLFPLALQCIFSYFIFPFFSLCVFLVFDPKLVWAQTHVSFVFILSLSIIVVSLILFALFERRWKLVINDTQRIISINWGLRGETE